MKANKQFIGYWATLISEMPDGKQRLIKYAFVSHIHGYKSQAYFLEGLSNPVTSGQILFIKDAEGNEYPANHINE